METLTALIVDDEAAARRDLEQVLATIDGVRIVAQASDAAAARQLARRHLPDLVFLDIQLPGADGFTALQDLNAANCCVIFTTAYAQFAIRAFEVGATDYLLKPVEEERCRRAIERAREILRRQSEESEMLEIEERGARRRIPINSIRLVTAAGNYLEIFHDHGHGLIRRTLEGLLAELAPAPFVRISRHHAVRAPAVRAIRGDSRRGLRLTLADGTELPVSRRRTPEVLAGLRGSGAVKPVAG
jgi:two-component system, LytTR family, response regulator